MLPVIKTIDGSGEIELPPRPCHADVEQPSLFLDFCFCHVLLPHGETAFLHADDENDRELRSLRRVQRHEGEFLARFVALIASGEQFLVIEKIHQLMFLAHSLKTLCGVHHLNAPPLPRGIFLRSRNASVL